MVILSNTLVSDQVSKPPAKSAQSSCKSFSLSCYVSSDILSTDERSLTRISNKSQMSMSQLRQQKNGEKMHGAVMHRVFNDFMNLDHTASGSLQLMSACTDSLRSSSTALCLKCWQKKEISVVCCQHTAPYKRKQRVNPSYFRWSCLWTMKKQIIQLSLLKIQQTSLLMYDG